MTMIGRAAAAKIAVMPTMPKKAETPASDTAETSAVDDVRLSKHLIRRKNSFDIGLTAH
jgi:tetrahydromethanopterin S-methyltransferase subunit F